MDAATRPERFPPDAIEALVREFYGRVRQDPALGPIFARRVADWPAHQARMVAFWRAVLRGERTFTMSERGAPPVLHRAIAELELGHFERWLALFGEVADAAFDPAAARQVRATADRIALSLSRHLRSPLPVTGG